ncbi:hypothetical protein ACIRYZ_44775 [Kitasatospora sp. NPDC101155]
MPHRNAPLTETGPLRLARCVVDWARLVERIETLLDSALPSPQ